jgi:tetratricopeptide (TPR) repeat protein
MRTAEGALNYHDIVLYRAPGGEIKAADIYIAATGELMSETLHRSLLQVAAHENRTILQRLSGSQADFIKHLPKVQEFATHTNQKRFAEALAVYRQLPPSLQQEKSMLVLRIAAAQRIGDVEYAAAIDDLLKHHPDDPSAGLFMIDAAFQKGDWAGALSAVDTLDKSIGGDPYLDLPRANLALQQGDYAKAKELLAKLETWNSQLVDAQWISISVALAEGDFDEVVRRLRKVNEELGVELADLSTLPEYAQFVKSPQYAEWMKSRGSR